MMNIILAAVHSQPNIFLISGIIMMTASCLKFDSKLNPTDLSHKHVTACLFPVEGFRDAVCELVESERE